MSQPAGAVSQQRGANAQRNGTEMRAYRYADLPYRQRRVRAEHRAHSRDHQVQTDHRGAPRAPVCVGNYLGSRSGGAGPGLAHAAALPGAGAGTRSRILVVSRPALETETSTEDEREPFGLIIDRVNHVVRINDADVEPPTVLAGHESEFVAGISRIKLAGEEVQKPALRYGPGLVAAEQYRIVIPARPLRVLTFEHGGSMRF